MHLRHFQTNEDYISYISRVRSAEPDTPATDLASFLIGGRYKISEDEIVEDTIVDFYGGGPIELENGEKVEKPIAPETVIRHSEQDVKSELTEDHIVAYYMLVDDLEEVN